MSSVDLTDVYSPLPKEHCEVLWQLMVERSQEDDPNVNISHRALPSREEHEQFFYSKPYYRWYLVSIPSPPPVQYVGSVSITRRNEIGIVLFADARGLGFGRQALEALIERHEPLPAKAGVRPGHFLANINPGNARSIHLFTSLGFELCQQTYKLENA